MRSPDLVENGMIVLNNHFCDVRKISCTYLKHASQKRELIEIISSYIVVDIVKDESDVKNIIQNLSDKILHIF